MNASSKSRRTIPQEPSRSVISRTQLPRQQIAALAELRDVHAAFAWFRQNEEKLSRWQMEFSGIAAPPFGEAPRAAWLRKKFQELGVHSAEIDAAGNVVACTAAEGEAQECIALAAHIDTVFAAGTPVNIRREGERLCGPGISDNGSGVTALLAIAAALAEADIQTSIPILFVGTVGEEGEGNLRGVRHLFNESAWKDRIQSVLAVDGAGTETIVNNALGSRRFQVTMRGKGGHSWSDFGTANPIAALASVVTEFYKTRVPNAAKKKSAYNVGVIAGGTSVNSIPESATMRVDLRSESAEQIDQLEEILRRCVEDALAKPAQPSHGGSGKNELSCEIKKIGDRPAAELAAGARILQIVRAVDAHLGVRSHLHCSSTDANIPLALGKEAVSIGAGGGGGGAHTLNEWYEPAGRDLGLKRILLVALALAGVDQ